MQDVFILEETTVIEDNQTVRYIGKGQLEPWGLDKYYKKD